jgi:hypothetical protein
MPRRGNEVIGGRKKRRGRNLIRLAALGAIVAWFVQRNQKGGKPEGSWRDLGSKR